MKLNVKSPKEKHEVEVSDTASVQELRTAVAEKFATSFDKICLIFGGKILKDEEALSQHSIRDGLTVHLVVRAGNNKSEQPSTAQSSSGSAAAQPSAAPPSSGSDASQTGASAAAANNPFASLLGMGGLGGAGAMGLGGLGGMGAMGGNMAEMQQRVMSNLVNNPEQLRAIMDSPFMREITSNPEVFRNILQSNPQFRDLTERNPELGHLLNNPDVLRQSLELARNPAMLNEMMRNYDRSLANVENLPGGFAALQRMYRDVQDPLMNAAQEAFGAPNPYAATPRQQPASTAGSTGANSAQQGAENLAPLPNPWSNPRSSAARPAAAPSGLAAAFGGNGNGTANVFQQMANNPDFVRSMMQSPITQSMMQSMMSDPAVFESVLNTSPVLAGQPQFAEELRTQMRTIMGNPALQRMMTNPRVLAALAQIQSGILSLQREDMELASMLGFGFPFPGSASLLAATQPSVNEPQTVPGQQPADTAAQSTSGDASRPATGEQSAGTQQSPSQNDAFANMMNQVVQMLINQRSGQQPAAGSAATQPSAGGSLQQPNENTLAQLGSLLGALGDASMGTGQAGLGAPNVAPEQRFATQLAQLEAMGFYDRQANLQALIATHGNVNAAIDRILQSYPPP